MCFSKYSFPVIFDDGTALRICFSIRSGKGFAEYFLQPPNIQTNFPFQISVQPQIFFDGLSYTLALKNFLAYLNHESNVPIMLSGDYHFSTDEIFPIVGGEIKERLPGPYAIFEPNTIAVKVR